MKQRLLEDPPEKRNRQCLSPNLMKSQREGDLQSKGVRQRGLNLHDDSPSQKKKRNKLKSQLQKLNQKKKKLLKRLRK